MSTAVVEEEKKMVCYDCSEPIDMNDSLGVEINGKWRDVCVSCYHEHVKTCQACGDTDVMESDESEFILVKTELGKTCQRPPGIYRVTRKPFIVSGLCCGGELTAAYVRFVAPLPKKDAEYDISGHICKKCAKTYRKAWTAAYRCDPVKMVPYAKEAWEKEKAHTRATILANPDMLRDLECDKDEYQWSQWNTLKTLYDLPDTIPTYHEQLLLEHKGIRVFYTYSKDCAWLTLRPEPKHRISGYSYGGFTFDPTSLPTWRKDSDEYRRDYLVENRRAVIDAIDQGILTQDGVKNPK